VPIRWVVVQPGAQHDAGSDAYVAGVAGRDGSEAEAEGACDPASRGGTQGAATAGAAGQRSAAGGEPGQQSAWKQSASERQWERDGTVQRESSAAHGWSATERARAVAEHDAAGEAAAFAE